MNPKTRLKILKSFKETSNMRLTSEQCAVPFNTVCKVIADERRTKKILKAKGEKPKPILESFHVSALRLFKEFNCVTTVSVMLGVKYHRVINVLDQERINQNAAKKLAAVEISEWPNRYAESQSRSAKYRRKQKEMLRLGIVRDENQKDGGIAFGYGNNDFLKGDVVERNTHKHDDQVRIRKTGSKQRINHDYSPALWQQ